MPKSDPVPVPSAGTPSPLALQGALAVGVLAVSSAAVLIKMAAAPPVSIAFWRMALTALILLPWAVRQGPPKSVGARDIGWVMVSGVLLALHFVTWIWSLQLIPVAIATALVSTHPLLVAGFTRLVWRHPLPPATIRGGAVVMAGIVLSLLQPGQSVHQLWGIALALGGSLFGSGYLLIGQRMRQHLTTTVYAFSVYTVAALVLAVIQIGIQHNFGPMSLSLLLIYAAMAVLPTLAGHTLFNWLLRYVPATTVSLALNGEIAGATVLAWLVLGQIPSFGDLAGTTLIFAGLYVAIRKPRLTAPL